MAVSGVDSSTLLNQYIESQKATSTTTTSSSSSGTETSISKVTGDFNTFLKILTTQMKNQDPTSPMDANTFTQQLVQFSGIEQQINTNSKLDSILKALNSNNITPLMSYVGQYIEVPADNKMVVQGGTAKLAYTLPNDALSVSIAVKDSTGKTVATIDAPTTKGLNRIAWDGQLSTGAQAADGVYKFVLTAKDSSGSAMTLDDVRLIGQVTGIETDTSGAATLKVGDLSVSDTSIKSVFAGVSTTAQNSSASTATTTG